LFRKVLPVVGWGVAFAAVAKDVRAEGVQGAAKLQHVENLASNAPVAGWLALAGDATIGSVMLGGAALSGSPPAYQSLADAYPGSAAFWQQFDGSGSETITTAPPGVGKKEVDDDNQRISEWKKKVAWAYPWEVPVRNWRFKAPWLAFTTPFPQLHTQ